MKVGVIGAGTMGAGIAQVFAQTDGYEVTLCDITAEIASKGKNNIASRLAGLVSKGKFDLITADKILSRITTGTIEAAADCELIIEATIEDMTAKKALFASLSKICNKNTIFVSNTSSLSITEISNGLDRPVIGMHFFNPAPVMKLVEITPGLGVPEVTAQKVKNIAEDIGKVPVMLKESAGFIVNRLLIPMINEAIDLYAKDIATAEDIDTAMKLGANHPMGPLEIGDLVGLDVCLAIMEVLQKEIDDKKYHPHPYLEKMVQDGMLGRKSGKGFYEYGKAK
ncbi:MAG: 3-hydroxybutyryl-CoA dehydrogenase [Oscillospiraceae bacterium]|nr:3-hydroxybutyryl-CoA dehydrogenase [Oscillospiraceae bacterium]